ncbi:MAG: HAD family hydrolase [Candidatus Parvarchaeota archaeon]
MRNEKIAVILDFDETLAPDSTSLLLESYGYDVGKFWNEVSELIKKGFEPTHAYLTNLLSLIGKDKPLGEISKEDLKSFGKNTIDKKFFPGIPQIFKKLKKVVREHEDCDIEFYIISGGLEEILEGSTIVRDHFKYFYGSKLGEDDNKNLRYIQRAITFTEKTRYIFEINKGISPKTTLSSPYEVNKDVPINERRIPFSNMIYIGDGRSDIPCFSLVSKGPAGGTGKGGYAFAVYRKDEQNSLSSLLETMGYIKDKRVLAAYSPDYSENSDLYKTIYGAVMAVVGDIELRRRIPY